MSTPGGGLRRSRSGQAPDDRAAGSAGPAARRGLFSAGWVGLLGAVLAAAAASVVVLSDDPRWLRLAGVAALWAALLALVVLVRRGAADCRRAADAEAEAERLRRAYESELAEIEGVLTARREYEDSLEHDLRRELAREAEERHGDEIAGLRAEVERLQAHHAEVRAPRQRMTALDSGPGERAVAATAGSPLRAAASMPVPPTVPPPVRAARVAWPTAPAPPAPAPPSALATGRVPRAHPAPRAASPAIPEPPPPAPAAPAVPPGVPFTTGRTVAELLAAHSAAARAAPRVHHRSRE